MVNVVLERTRDDEGDMYYLFHLDRQLTDRSLRDCVSGKDPDEISEEAKVGYDDQAEDLFSALRKMVGVESISYGTYSFGLSIGRAFNPIQVKQAVVQAVEYAFDEKVDLRLASLILVADRTFRENGCREIDMLLMGLYPPSLV